MVSVPSQEYDPFHHKEPNLGQTKTIRQHFVPRLWLRNFTDSQGSLLVCDCQDGRVFESTVENTAVRKRMYDIPLADGSVLSLEDWFSNIEGRADSVLRKIVDEPESLVALSVEDENSFARLLAAQLLRIPMFIRAFGLDSAAQMLEEVQGDANILRALPWRIGRSSGPYFYTSDNPMAGFATAVRDPWETSLLWSRTYHIPLSTNVALRIGLKSDIKGRLKPRGPREARDFNSWEASFTRNVVTAAAERYLFGPEPHIPLSDALPTLNRINLQKLLNAVSFSGFDPTWPPSRPMSSKLRKLVYKGRTPPDNPSGVAHALMDFYAGTLPLDALMRWIPEISYIGEMRAGSPVEKVAKELAVSIAFLHGEYATASEVRGRAMRLVGLLIREQESVKAASSPASP
jgi:Protein of unknown function (DUF4238)